MAKFKFEYIWLDGYTPEPSLRSKTKVLEFEYFGGELDALPEWSFDGSSTQQVEGHSSDCLLKPVAVYPGHERKNAFLVVCEVLNPDGTPHPSNMRVLYEDDEDFWFGFEYAVSDRGASQRIPVSTANDGWKGYLEDRRPASNADPYKVTGRILKTVKSALVPA